MGVHFKPGGASPFLGVPARDLEGRHVPLEALWGAAARALRDRVLAAPSGQPRLLALEAALLERMCGARGRRRDHFDREFRHFTGLNPRAYRDEAIERPSHVPLRG
jgi:hypothetical protein